MSYFFLIQSGPLKGTRHLAQANMTLGRGFDADLSIADPKMSSIHVQIQEKQGQLYLIDKGSKNKIRLQGIKQESVLLKNNLIFQIGGTQIQVERLSQDTHPSLGDKKWHQLLYEELGKQKFENSPPQKKLKALSPAISLTFITGLQRKTKWTLGYGPRNIGSNSYDLPIIGENIPPVCFSISPSADGTFFQTTHPKKVLLNKHSKEKIKVKNLDIIYIDNIQIQIHLL